MRTKKNNMSKSYLLFIYLLLGSLLVNGQRLPSVQNKSIYASKFAQDFSGTEAIKLEAYNKGTGIYYSISNDEENLYLTILSKDALIIKKIFYGNITFSVETPAKGYMSLTFPFIDLKKRDDILKKVNNITSTKVDSSAKKSQDSLINVLNTLLKSNSFIKQNGLELKDSLIKFSSTDEIKANGGLNNTLAYYCQLIIPAKYLKAAFFADRELKYKIKLNGRLYNTNTKIVLSNDGQFSQKDTPGFPSVAVKVAPETLILDFPTDLSGTYILAKKE